MFGFEWVCTSPEPYILYLQKVMGIYDLVGKECIYPTQESEEIYLYGCTGNM